MKTSASITNIVKARIAAKLELQNPKKDGTNPHFKSRYVTYESLIKSIETAMLPHGLDMYTQLVNSEEGSIGCIIKLVHSSGEFIETDPFFVPCAQRTAQGYGSACTYVQRYCVSSFWTIAAQEDDDGSLATQTSGQKKILPTAPDVSTNEQKDKHKIIFSIKSILKNKKIDEKIMYNWLSSQYKVSSIDELNIQQLNHLLIKLNKV